MITRVRLLYLYRILAALCVLATIWALLLWLTGGFRVDLGGLRISSQRPRNAVIISLASAALVWLLTYLPEGRDAFRSEWERWRRWSASTILWRQRVWRILLAAAAPAIAVAAIGIDVYVWQAAPPFWVDEEMIALNLRDRTMGDLAGALWLGQSAPFGWLVLQRIAMALLGTGEAAMRTVPLLFGIATLGIAVWVGRLWMGRVGAAVFVLLCWISSWLSHYRFEVKHYTADVLFGLLIPVLAARAIEAEEAVDRARRTWFWWMTAAIGHWFANGALLVTPACAIVVGTVAWRRDGRRAVPPFVLGGLLWLASFGLHYLISIRHTLHSALLRETWITEVLPTGLGAIGSLGWLLKRLEPLANNPGGTGLAALLWISAICGWAFGMRRSTGVVALAGVPLSAFAFASVVPLHERFSIWIVPALFAGVVLLIDRAVQLATDALGRRNWMLLAGATLILILEFRLVADIFIRGRVDLANRVGATLKHQLDDRAAIRWLMSQQKPGDLLMTTRLAMSAVWWYGNIPISDEAGAGSALPDGSPVYEVAPATDCPSSQLEDALANRRRVLLYLGFDFTPGFDRVLVSSLAQHGILTAYGKFGPQGRAAVIDLGTRDSGAMMQLDRTPDQVDFRGCVGIKRAERW